MKVSELFKKWIRSFKHKDNWSYGNLDFEDMPGVSFSFLDTKNHAFLPPSFWTSITFRTWLLTVRTLVKRVDLRKELEACSSTKEAAKVFLNSKTKIDTKSSDVDEEAVRKLFNL